jgi:hypothetical protein
MEVKILSVKGFRYKSDLPLIYTQIYYLLLRSLGVQIIYSHITKSKHH